MSSDFREDHEDINELETNDFNVEIDHIPADAQVSPETEALLGARPFLQQQLGLSGIGLEDIDDSLKSTGEEYGMSDILPLVKELDGAVEGSISFDSVNVNQGATSNMTPRSRRSRSRKEHSEDSLMSRIKKRKIGNVKGKQPTSPAPEVNQPGDSQLPASVDKNMRYIGFITFLNFLISLAQECQNYWKMI
jgi:hypothetical protein